MILQNVLDLSYNQIKRVCLQIMYGGEGPPEFPWQQQSASEPADELAAGLGFPAGCVWYDDPRSTIRFTAAPYVAGDGDPLNWYATRHYVESVEAVTSVAITHNLHVIFPHVQIIERVGVGPYEFHLYDLFGAGGDVRHVDGDIIEVDFGTTFTGYVVVIG